MFESMTDRIAGTVLMGLDVAVEFATLGEFRLVEADASPAPDLFQAAPLVRRPSRLATVEPDRQLLPPASTAIAPAAASPGRPPPGGSPRLHPRPSPVPPPSRQRASPHGAGRPGRRSSTARRP